MGGPLRNWKSPGSNGREGRIHLESSNTSRDGTTLAGCFARIANSWMPTIEPANCMVCLGALGRRAAASPPGAM
jgi:hypothetical protein